MNTPCKPDCENRSATCHIKGNCDKWTEYKEKQDRIKQKKKDDEVYRDYVMGTDSWKKLRGHNSR